MARALSKSLIVQRPSPPSWVSPRASAPQLPNQSVQAAGIRDRLPSGSTASNNGTPRRFRPLMTARRHPSKGCRLRMMTTEVGRSWEWVVCGAFVQLNSARAVDAKSEPPHRRWAFTPRHQTLAYSAGGGGHRRAVGADRRSAKDEAGNPAGRSDFAAAGKLLLPALPASLARPWPSGPTRCPRRQLRRRLRHLLPTWQRAGGDGADGDEMPFFLSSAWYSTEQYWLPRSAW